MATETPPDECAALTLVMTVLRNGIDGVTGFCSAEQLAEQYRNAAYGSMDERINAMIMSASGQSFCSGFALQMGGLLKLPAGLLSTVANYLVQGRLVAATASRRTRQELCQRSSVSAKKC